MIKALQLHFVCCHKYMYLVSPSQKSLGSLKDIHVAIRSTLLADIWNHMKRCLSFSDHITTSAFRLSHPCLAILPTPNRFVRSHLEGIGAEIDLPPNSPNQELAVWGTDDLPSLPSATTT